jgi:hypothetical protein
MGQTCCDKIGGIYVLVQNSKGEAIVTIGPHWGYFAGTYIFILLVAVVVLAALAPLAGAIWLEILGIVVFGVALLSYALAALKNPGIETAVVVGDNLESLLQDGERRLCQICGVEKESRTVHCIDCDV